MNKSYYKGIKVVLYHKTYYAFIMYRFWKFVKKVTRDNSSNTMFGRFIDVLYVRAEYGSWDWYRLRKNWFR